MRRTDLVFRTVGERTAELALELALRHVKPARVEVVDGVRPLSAAVDRALALRLDCDQVVYLDADCLLLEDVTGFLARNRRPHVECFVTDRFRGRIHCGMRVTRIDVVRAMATLGQALGERDRVLRPDSQLRALALRRLGSKKTFRNFDVLHDHFQFRRDLVAKYALRELRARGEDRPDRLDQALDLAGATCSAEEVLAARLGVEHARARVPLDAGAEAIGEYVGRLSSTSTEVLASAGLAELGPMSAGELEDFRAARPEPPPGARPKVFGIGLSRTGTRSLTMALHVLGLDTVHYPADQATFEDLAGGRYALSALEDHDGVTDITVAPFYAQLDRLYPGAKFVLTVRDRQGWLRSTRHHYEGRPAFGDESTPELRAYMNVRRLLRAAVYGCYSFEPERFSWVYELHVKNVLDYFEGRPDSLLVLDICGGQGWEPLCRFLGQRVPLQPFPHKGRTVLPTERPPAEPAGVPRPRTPALVGSP